MDLLRGVIREYDWGDADAIAELLGHEPPGHPEAEYWLGAHPSAPSIVIETGDGLDRLVSEEPIPTVGPVVWDRFAQLPFLLKVLAAGRPLSIQAHPTSDQAGKGFAREDEAGIERDAPNRNYRDGNHKPELICALTRFEAKCGFRALPRTRLLIDGLAAGATGDGLAPLIGHLNAPGSDCEVLAATVAWLLGLPARSQARLARAVVAAATDVDDRLLDDFGKEIEWVARIAGAFPDDIGIVVSLLLNHVTLAPGEAIFLGAGNLHSYLEGVGIELMANSDNVVRGGLTHKHIDVAELLAVVDYRPSAAPVQAASSPVHRFDAPVPEFALTRLDSTIAELGRHRFEPVGPEIVLVTAGSLSLVASDATLDLGVGDAGFVRYGDGAYTVVDRTPGRTVAWRASVGIEPAS